MCANFKSLTLEQLRRLNLPEIDFDYPEEVYPLYDLPLLFMSPQQQLEWRCVKFGLIPKWAEDTRIATKTYNARNETLLQKASFAEALQKHKFAVFPVTEFYESMYIENKPERWGVRRKDGEAFFIAGLYEITRIQQQIVRSATMLTMDAIDHDMMKHFHEPGNVKRSVIIIPKQRLHAWLSYKSTDIRSFIEGFPVDEFECFPCPKEKVVKESPQLSMF